MSKKMIKNLALALDMTALTPAAATVTLNESPFMGGQGRSAILQSNAVIGGAGVLKIQGHPGVVSDDGQSVSAPVFASEGWVDIVSLTATSPLLQEIELPAYIRANVTTVGTGTATVNLEGVQ